MHARLQSYASVQQALPLSLPDDTLARSNTQSYCADSNRAVQGSPNIMGAAHHCHGTVCIVQVAITATDMASDVLWL